MPSAVLLQRVVSSLGVDWLPNLTQTRHCALLKVLHAEYQTVKCLAKKSDGAGDADSKCLQDGE